MSVEATPILKYLNTIADENKTFLEVSSVNRFKQTAIDKVRDFILKGNTWADWATPWLRFKDVATLAIHTYIIEREGRVKEIAKPHLFPEITRKDEEFKEKISSFLDRTANSHCHSENLPTDVDYWSYEMGQIGSKWKELVDVYTLQQEAEARAPNFSA